MSVPRPPGADDMVDLSRRLRALQRSTWNQLLETPESARIARIHAAAREAADAIDALLDSLHVDR